MNVIAGRNGLIPCLLVFEVSPSIPNRTHNLLIQRKRMIVLSVARSEMVKVMAKQRVLTALRRQFPKMTDHDVPIGSDVFLYKERPRNECGGPYKEIAEDKIPTVDVDRRIISCNANSTGARFTSVLKDSGTANEIPKARYVARGYYDKIKPFILLNDPELRQFSKKLVTSFAALLEFSICPLEITQAYLQAKDKLSQKIFIRPKQNNVYFLGIERRNFCV